MKKQKLRHNLILFISLPLVALALFIMNAVSGYDTSGGTEYIHYEASYIWLLLGEYTVCTLLLLSFNIKADKESHLNAYILPLMLFASLGMMRIDSPVRITSAQADHTPSVMFLILLVTLVITALTSAPVLGAMGTVTGTLIYPAFGLCFAPFIAAAAFLTGSKNDSGRRLSVILNTVLSTAAAVFSVIKLERTEPSFDKRYIPVLIAVAAMLIFFAVKKEFRLLPLSILPLFPLAAGIFFGVFPTASFTLAASIAATVITLGSVILKGNNEKIKGYAQALVHNPGCFIIIAAFILHCVSARFLNPGYFRGSYM